MDKKKVVIIGSTGSVGSAAIDVVKLNPSFFEVEALIANSSFQLVAKQALEVKAKKVFLSDSSNYKNLQIELQSTEIECFASREEIINFIANESKAETILIASSGSESLLYFYEALKTNKRIAIANKESIVCLGDLFQEFIKQSKAEIIPVDSEHSALFQVLSNNNANVKELILTASGGPFLNFSHNELKNVTKKDALSHPTWNMGQKITIDSATFVNKALEIIETSYLFDISVDKIEVLVHPQSIIHGAVTYDDGSFIAHMSYPSMKIPVAYALSYPQRIKTDISTLKLSEIKSLQFQNINDFQKIPIKLAKEAVKKGGNYPCVFNVTNELLVNYFLQDKIKFTEIIKILEYVLNKIQYKKIKNLEDILQEYVFVKNFLKENINKII